MSNRKSENAGTCDLEHYLKNSLSKIQIANMMRLEGKDDKEIDMCIDKYEQSKHKVSKLVKKFTDKILAKYGNTLDVPELVKKGMKYADKNNFTEEEKNAFMNHVMKGDVNIQYNSNDEVLMSEMAKLFGMSNIPGLMLDIKAPDQAILDEIAQLYELSKQAHYAVKSNLAIYTDCAPEALSCTFDKEKHNANIFIHPVIVALFLPKIKALEERMLITNIGRLVISRASQYLRKYASVMSETLQTEVKADFELMLDIAKDPNSLNYFSKETPISNLLKRFKIQVELYRNVVSLRQGKVFSKSEFGIDDAISGLSRILQSYEWTYFDSPDMYHIHDEGSMLRKLLAVFSLRPTFTQLSSFSLSSNMGQANFGASKLVFIKTPIINVRLPRNQLGMVQHAGPVQLQSAMQSVDYFIEKNMIVPKQRQVIYSKDLVFFYANRRYQTVNFTSLDMSFRYMTLPGSVSNVTKINETELIVPPQIGVSNDRYDLRSVVVINKMSMSEFATTGCSSIIVCPRDINIGRNNTTYFYYNPVAASLLRDDGTPNGAYTQTPPIQRLPEHSVDPKRPGFENLSRKNGTIFVYVKVA